MTPVLLKNFKEKKTTKIWETLIISENLSWDQFAKINFYLHELSGAKPVLSVARNYPYKEKFTHLLGYVAQASENDLIENEAIKKSRARFKSWKNWFRKLMKIN